MHSACLYRATTLRSANGSRVLARAQATSSAPEAPLIVAGAHGHGRVVVLADSDLFGDDCIGELDHRTLWLNLVSWVAAGERSTEEAGAVPSRVAQATSPGWAQLRDETNALALLQAPDGSLDGDAVEQAARHVERCSTRSPASGARFPHQTEYLHAVREDLRAWVDGGFARPDFTRSLEAFRPERDRRDGVESLVVFPMYKQNGSRDTCFEALVIRVPWPEHVAELERTRYDNEKFVPVELIDSTRGYDSECATLFPETVRLPAVRSTTSGRSSATARPSAYGGSPAPRPTCCRSTSRRMPRRCSRGRTSPSRPTSCGT